MRDIFDYGYLIRYFKWVDSCGLFEAIDSINLHYDFMYRKNNDPMAKMKTA